MNVTRLSPSRRLEDIRAWWAEHLQAHPDSGQSQAPAGPSAPTGADEPAGTSFSPRELLERIDRQELLGHDLLALGVLGFEELQPPRLGHIHAAVLVAPAVKGLFGDVVAPADSPNLGVGSLSFPQDPDDLFFGKSLLHL